MIEDIPLVIGLGTHKGASSWIFACLYEHPELCIPYKDEHFFYLDRLFNNGKVYFEEEILKHYKNEKVIGDFSTLYFSSPDALKRIKALYPTAKLFVCLRNPVDRAFSHYIQDLKVGHLSITTSFETALKDHKEYIQHGKYKNHLQKLWQDFSKEQLKVVFFDDIKQKPLEFIQELYTFIGVNSQFTPSYSSKTVNSQKVTKYFWINRIMTKIARGIKTNSFGQKVWWRIKKSSIPEYVRKFNSTENTIQLNEDTRQQLQAAFQEDIDFVKTSFNRQDLNW